jgi:DHA1 family multidrug resistance protein-like MFS transporter
MVDWKRNLAAVWLSQFFSIAGFSFALPFAPFYMQRLGVTDPLELKLYVALFEAAAPLSLAIFAPLWGAAGDRWGRRLMLLRANIGAAIFLTMMGGVTNVGQLLAVRCLQGVLTGSMNAAQTLVSVHTPAHRSGLAMGALSSAVFSGAMAGSFLGGFFADAFGYRAAFFVAGGILLLATLIVLFAAQDAPMPEAASERPRGSRRDAATQILRPFLPALVLVAAVSVVRRFDAGFLPLLVQEMRGAVEGSARWSGGLFAIGSVAGLLSGVSLGHLSDRFSPTRILRLCAIGGGLLLIPQAWIQGFPSLFGARFAMAFCLGGLEPVLQAWIARVSPERSRGFLFGFLTTARSVGWGVAALASGAVASALGVRAVFYVGGALCLALALAIAPAFRRADAATGEAPRSTGRGPASG